MIVEFVDHLKLGGIGVMMQDWGGPIGLHLAQARPEAINRLIIGNTFGWPFTRPGPRIFSAIMGGLPGRIGALTFNAILRWFFTAGVVSPLSPEVWKMYQAPFRRRGSRRPTYVFPGQLTAAHDFLLAIEEKLPILSDKPALILWGERDFAFKEFEHARFRTIFPKHRDITLRNAGHFIQEDAPEEICAAITQWYSG